LCKDSNAIVNDMMSAVEPPEGAAKKQNLIPTWLTALRANAALVTDSRVRKQMSGYDSDDDANESDHNVLRLRENKTRMSAVRLLQTMYTEEHAVETIFRHLCKNIPSIMHTIKEGVDEGLVAADTDLFLLCVKATRYHMDNSDIFKHGCTIVTALYQYDGWHDRYTGVATSMLIEGFCKHRKDVSVVSCVMCQINAPHGENPSVVDSIVGLCLQSRLDLTAAVCGIMDHCVAQKMHNAPSPGPALRSERAQLIEAACKVMGMVWACVLPDYYSSSVFKTSLQTFDNVVKYFQRPELNDGMIVALESLLSSVSTTRHDTNVQTVGVLLQTNLVGHVCEYWRRTMTRNNDMRMLSIVYEVIRTGHTVPDHSSIIRHCLSRGLALSQSAIRVHGFHRRETFVAQALGAFLHDASQRPDEKSQRFVVRQGILTICVAMIGDMTPSRRNAAGDVTNADQKKTRLWLELLSLAVADKRKHQTLLIDMDGLELLQKLVNVGKGNETTPLEIAACTLMSCLVVQNFKKIDRSIFGRSIGAVARAIVYATSRGSGVTGQQATLCVQTLEFLREKGSLDHTITLRSFVTMANLIKTRRDMDDGAILQKGIVNYLFNVWTKDPHHTKYTKRDYDRCIFVFYTHPLLAEDEEYQLQLAGIRDHWR